MLDLHAVSGTPGAVTTLGSAFSTIPSSDGQSVAGVPISPAAVLRMFGGLSPTANTIAALKLQSQDQVDPINGETLVSGAASLLNILAEFTTLPYKTGLRAISMGTNTAQTASLGFLLDEYTGGKVAAPGRLPAGKVITPPVTFGGALTANTWGSVAFNPSTALPNGKYAILGARVSAIANAALIRFSHADFGTYMPGFPVANFETISSATWDKIDKEDLLLTQAGEQFTYLGEVTGRPQCPVFSVSNAGTGLVIWMADVQADTPVVHLSLAKVG